MPRSGERRQRIGMCAAALVVAATALFAQSSPSQTPPSQTPSAQPDAARAAAAAGHADPALPHGGRRRRGRGDGARSQGRHRQRPGACRLQGGDRRQAARDRLGRSRRVRAAVDRRRDGRHRLRHHDERAQGERPGHPAGHRPGQPRQRRPDGDRIGAEVGALDAGQGSDRPPDLSRAGAERRLHRGPCQGRRGADKCGRRRHDRRRPSSSTTSASGKRSGWTRRTCSSAATSSDANAGPTSRSVRPKSRCRSRRCCRTRRRTSQPVLRSLRSTMRGLAKFPGPKHAVLLSSGWAMNERDASTEMGWVAADAARANVTIHTFTAEMWALAASRSRPSMRSIEDRNLLMNNVEMLAGMTGGRSVRLSGQADTAFASLSQGLSGYYRLGVQALARGPGRQGPSHLPQGVTAGRIARLVPPGAVGHAAAGRRAHRSRDRAARGAERRAAPDRRRSPGDVVRAARDHQRQGPARRGGRRREPRRPGPGQGRRRALRLRRPAGDGDGEHRRRRARTGQARSPSS